MHYQKGIYSCTKQYSSLMLCIFKRVFKWIKFELIMSIQIETKSLRIEVGNSHLHSREQSDLKTIETASPDTSSNKYA